MWSRWSIGYIREIPRDIWGFTDLKVVLEEKSVSVVFEEAACKEDNEC